MTTSRTGDDSESESAGASEQNQNRLREAAVRVGNILFPPLCLSCHAPLSDHDALCAPCWGKIDFIRPPLCDRLGLPMPYDAGGAMISAAAAAAPPAYDRARAVAHYDGVMRKLVHDLKFRDQHAVRRLFGRWLVEAGREIMKHAEVVVPVPLGRWRLIRRQFNQAAILGREISRLSGIPYAPTALARTRKTASQVGLSRAERRANVSGAFSVARRHAAAIEGRAVLLVDDVITTGATAEACATALRRAGAARVDVLALALVTDTALVPA